MAHVSLGRGAMARHPALLLGLAFACSGKVDPPIPAPPPTPPVDAAATAPTSGVDISPVVAGVPDLGRDPAVVGIDVDHQRLCTGTLIATNVVLTARNCVWTTQDPWSCPATTGQVVSARLPQTLGILLGDDATTATASAHGAELLVPDTGLICDHDIAAIILDAEIPSVAPIKVSTAIPIITHHVRTIGFDNTGGKLLREFMPIFEISPAELEVNELSCNGEIGGPALDESTSELIGVVSRQGSSCDGPNSHNVYTRADAFQDLIAAALQEGLAQGGHHVKSAGKPPTDVGDPCTHGSDCSTGVCITTANSSYCSHTCDASERCPTAFHCVASGADKLCFEK
jgi:hypothetical protein